MTDHARTIGVHVGTLAIGGGAPVSVQTMTDTDTADDAATASQAAALVRAGAELVRVTVNSTEAAAAVPRIVARLHDAGIHVPIAGDFHYNGHRLLRESPACAQVLDKYRINPGNVGAGSTRDDRFHDICAIARDSGKAIRIGVNAGSLDQDLVAARMRENAASSSPKTGEAVVSECMVVSALQSLELALQAGLTEGRIVLSCKSSRPSQLIEVYRALAARTRQPLHLGLTEAGPGLKGLVWSTAAMSVLLAEGIGDTIRVSLTPRPGGDRCEEVYAAQEILQALGLRRFTPSVTACPGCGRTTSTFFQRLAEDTQGFLRKYAPEWRTWYPGSESLEVAVMGCVVNGPGESRAANIGISLPGAAEAPLCPVYADGRKVAVLRGTEAEIARDFLALVEDYVRRHYPGNGLGK